MLKMTRCKFVCQSKTGNENGYSIIMHAVYSGSEENKAFFNATPSGSLNLNIVKPAAVAQIEQGKEYYIDISPAN